MSQKTKGNNILVCLRKELNINAVEESLLKELEDLLNCNPDCCDGCSVQRQDEGDDESWCGVDSVLRKAITYIKHNKNI